MARYTGSVAEVKTGTKTGIADDATVNVTFANAFLDVPVVIAVQASTGKQHTIEVLNITIGGFDIHVIKDHGGPGDTVDVAWMASDAGDP